MEWILAIFGLIFGGVGVAALISQSNKEWTRLYQLYPGNSQQLNPSGLQLQILKLGEVYFKGCVAFATDINGLLITSPASRTTKRQPIYIPYSDMQVTGQETQTIPHLQILKIKKAPDIKIALDKNWANKIKASQSA